MRNANFSKCRDLYGRVQLTQAVNALAVGPGNVRFRLLSAFYYLAQVNGTRLPKDIRTDFQWVMSMLTRRQPRFQGPVVYESKVEASLASMRDTTGAKIAKRIVYMAARLHERLPLADCQ